MEKYLKAVENKRLQVISSLYDGTILLLLIWRLNILVKITKVTNTLCTCRIVSNFQTNLFINFTNCKILFVKSRLVINVCNTICQAMKLNHEKIIRFDSYTIVIFFRVDIFYFIVLTLSNVLIFDQFLRCESYEIIVELSHNYFLRAR